MYYGILLPRTHRQLTKKDKPTTTILQTHFLQGHERCGRVTDGVGTEERLFVAHYQRARGGGGGGGCDDDERQ